MWKTEIKRSLNWSVDCIYEKIQRARDSDDSDEERPKKVKRAPPRKRKKPLKKVSSASSESATEDESEVEHQVVAESNNPVDKLRVQFPHIPRSDITRVYYQNSCQFQKEHGF